jgi:hypothetical protein
LLEGVRKEGGAELGIIAKTKTKEKKNIAKAKSNYKSKYAT